MYVQHTISVILPSSYQNLLKLVETWQSSNKNKKCSFFLRHGVHTFYSLKNGTILVQKLPSSITNEQTSQRSENFTGTLFPDRWNLHGKMNHSWEWDVAPCVYTLFRTKQWTSWFFYWTKSYSSHRLVPRPTHRTIVFLRLSGYQKDEGHYVTDSFERDRHSASQLAKRLGYVKQWQNDYATSVQISSSAAYRILCISLVATLHKGQIPNRADSEKIYKNDPGTT